MPSLSFTLATVSLVSDIERKCPVSQHLDDDLHVTTQAISTWCTPTGSNSLVAVIPGVTGYVNHLILVEHCFDLALTSAAVLSSTRISASVLVLKLQGLLCNVLLLLRSSGLCPRLIRRASSVEGFLLCPCLGHPSCRVTLPERVLFMPAVGFALFLSFSCTCFFPAVGKCSFHPLWVRSSVIHHVVLDQHPSRYSGSQASLPYRRQSSFLDRSSGFLSFSPASSNLAMFAQTVGFSWSCVRFTASLRLRSGLPAPHTPLLRALRV